MTSHRDIVQAASFGALWGAIEITLGGALQAAHIPFRGTLLTMIGVGLALIGFSIAAGLTARSGNGRSTGRGFVLMCGVVAALLRLLSPSGQALFPMAAIMIEAGLAELALRAFRYRPSWPSFVAAATAALLWDFAHPFITQTLQAGVDLPMAYFRIVRKGASMMGVESASIALVIAALVALRLVAGLICGSAAMVLSRGLHRRLGLYADPGDR